MGMITIMMMMLTMMIMMMNIFIYGDGNIIGDDFKDDFKGVVASTLLVYDSHQENQGGEKGGVNHIFAEKIIFSETFLISCVAVNVWYLPLSRTSLVINKFSSKGAQDHATYLPGLVREAIL